MTREEIAALVLTADPNAQRYASTRRGNYTKWAEYRRLEYMADDEHIEGWAFQVDRFTKDEDDPIADAIFEALDKDERVSVQHLVDYEQETGYIHHIFDCEGF